MIPTNAYDWQAAHVAASREAAALQGRDPEVAEAAARADVRSPWVDDGGFEADDGAWSDDVSDRACDKYEAGRGL